MDSKNGNFSAGVHVLGLAEGGVDWALDDNNASLVTADMKAAVDAARNDIISGKVTVHDYTSDESCPY
jgi:basic membrane protein A